MAARTSAARRRTGATVVELVVSTAILVLVLGFAGLLGSTGQGAYRSASTKTSQELQVRRALDRVAAELAIAGRDTLLPPPDPQFGASELVFQQVSDIAGGAVQWGPLARLRLEYDDGETDDGTDEDGDGLVDEGRLVLTRGVGAAGEQTIVLCRDVSELLEGETLDADDDNGNGLIDERGFSLALAGDVLTLRLTMATPRPAGGPALRTLETSLKLRN